TAATYTIVSAALSDSGNYTVKALNSNGGVQYSSTSTPILIVVEVTGAPAISSQPQSQSMEPGATVVFAVNANGTISVNSFPIGKPTAHAATTVSYQWYVNGVAIAGATQST